MAVAMQRLVDKIPVDGPGGKIIVYFDSDRNLSGLEKIWRDIGGVHRRNQPWRPAESALDEMAEHFRTKQGIIEIQEMAEQPAVSSTGLRDFRNAHIP